MKHPRARIVNAIAIATSFAIAISGTVYQRHYGKNPVAANSSILGLIFYLLFQAVFNFYQVFFADSASMAIEQLAGRVAEQDRRLVKQEGSISRLRERLEGLGETPSDFDMPTF